MSNMALAGSSQTWSGLRIGSAFSTEMPGNGPSGDSLLTQVARALESQQIRYCQWKGHWSAHRWSSGQGDVDLLVDHASISQFRAIMGELGFKLALLPGQRQILGIESYLGHDPAVSTPLHLHVHYRLILGDYWKPVYRIPVEGAILAATVPGNPFRVPAPTHQFVVFVLRLMLRQLGRPLLSAQTRWLAGIQPPLSALESAGERQELASLLASHLPSIDLPFFLRCVRSLHGQAGLIERALLPWLLARRLRAHVRRPGLTAMVTAAVEKFVPSELAELLTDGRMRPAGGGCVVALVGGDGAGKSTCARELGSWLTPVFPTMRAHLGNPPRSILTWAVGGLLKASEMLARWTHHTVSPDSMLHLLRHLCTARDRHLLYVAVRRFAAKGGVAICERYPIQENRPLVGPCIAALLSSDAGRLARMLARREASYYDRMIRPDLICVLRLDPELAVIRKPEEPADYVRARGKVIWETDWRATAATVVDASQLLPTVVRELRSAIWRAL
jgi:hypothetical protein